jgi:hypothetical protein
MNHTAIALRTKQGFIQRKASIRPKTVFSKLPALFNLISTNKWSDQHGQKAFESRITASPEQSPTILVA